MQSLVFTNDDCSQREVVAERETRKLKGPVYNYSHLTHLMTCHNYRRLGACWTRDIKRVMRQREARIEDRTT